MQEWTWQWFLIVFFGLLFLALLITAIGYGITQSSMMKRPEAPRIRSPNGCLPKEISSLLRRAPNIPVLWSYWHDSTPGSLPNSVALSLASWHHFHPEACICMLSDDTIHLFLSDDELPIGFLTENGLVQHKSDVVRIALLAKYGGIWIDASMLVFANIFTRWKPWAKDVEYDVGGYTRPNLANCVDGTDNPCVLENWFIAAPRNNSLIRAWRDEVFRAATFQTRKTYRDDLKSRGVIGLEGEYLWMHNAFLYIRQQPAHLNAKIIATNSSSDGNPFSLCGFGMADEPSFFWRLAVIDAPTDPPLMVKLVSHHRNAAELLWMYVRRQSLLGMLQQKCGH